MRSGAQNPSLEQPGAQKPPPAYATHAPPVPHSLSAAQAMHTGAAGPASPPASAGAINSSGATEDGPPDAPGSTDPPQATKQPTQIPIFTHLHPIFTHLQWKRMSRSAAIFVEPERGRSRGEEPYFPSHR
jgi:hypothetical protein